MGVLTSYLLAAMITWQPPVSISQHTHYQDIVSNVIEVVKDARENAVFKEYGSEFNALLLLSTAWYESTYNKRVDIGKCKSNECGHGSAFTLWQIQPSRHGIVLLRGGWVYGNEVPAGVRVDRAYLGSDMIQDRKLAIRIALHMMRQSVKRTGSLCVYTGEWDVVRGRCKVAHPKASARFGLARKYVIDHPIPSDEVQ